MTTDNPIFHKPKSFIAAKNLLYASLFLTLINVIIHNLKLNIRFNFLVLGWCVATVGFILMIIFIKQMGLCKKWARTVLTVWFAIGFISVLISFFTPRANMSIPEITIWALKMVLQVIAVIFLYGKECENWFNSKKYEMFEK
jgi:hypothetical protein